MPYRRGVRCPMDNFPFPCLFVDNPHPVDILGRGFAMENPPALSAPTLLQRQLVDASLTIADLTPDRPEFLHAVLCQVGLPRARQETRVFQRTSGSASLLLEAGQRATGIGKWQEYPLPYGAMPRLVLYHLCSEAVRTQSNIVDVGGSVREFLRRVGISVGGKEFNRFKEQMTALSCCRMTLAYVSSEGRLSQMQASPIDSFDAWLHRDAAQGAFWPDVIELHPKFFSTLLEHAVPLDPRAIHALQKSSLALDVYTWLAHRLCRVRKADGVRLSWGNLRQQFGQEYACPKDFKKKFRPALFKVMSVYPDARLSEEPGGIRLLPSPPPVPKSQVLVKLA